MGIPANRLNKHIRLSSMHTLNPVFPYQAVYLLTVHPPNKGISHMEALSNGRRFEDIFQWIFIEILFLRVQLSINQHRQWFGAELPIRHYDEKLNFTTPYDVTKPQYVPVNPYQAMFINTLRPRQNGRHFADDIFNCIHLNENVWMLNKNYLNHYLNQCWYVLLTHICFTRL